MKSWLPILLLAVLAASCTEQRAEGVWLELSLDNDADIGTYVVFNPNLKTIAECEAAAEDALPSIVANMPAEIPRNSKVTGWKCFLTNPGEGKMREEAG